MTYLTLAAGVVYLLMGADLLVRGAVALARRARVSETVVALTVVAFGTSLPELVVAVEAALLGYPGIVLGNVVGSNIANVMLVVGLAAVIWPLSSQEASSRRDAGIMVGGSVLFAAACVTGQVHWGWGLVLLGAMVAASIPSVRDAARAQRTTAGSTPLDSVLGLPTQRRFIWLFIVLGLVGLPMGAQMVVESAVAIGQAWASPKRSSGSPWSPSAPRSRSSLRRSSPPGSIGRRSSSGPYWVAMYSTPSGSWPRRHSSARHRSRSLGHS